MATKPAVEEPIDGRTARAVRTKDAIVDSCIALIDAGDLRPTGPRIAERAGVSVRSIFQHFDDLDALFAAVGERVNTRVLEVVSPIDPALALDARINEFVDQRSEALEAVTPVLRAALVYAASSVVIRNQFDSGHQFFCQQIETVFAPELEAASDRELLWQTLVVSLSWTTWELLRGLQGLSIEAATVIVRSMVDSAMEAASLNLS